jgi:hypothetical protein
MRGIIPHAGSLVPLCGIQPATNSLMSVVSGRAYFVPVLPRTCCWRSFIGISEELVFRR